MFFWVASIAYAGSCVSVRGEVDLACLGGSVEGLQLTEHSGGGPGGGAEAFLHARYPAIARCLAALPEREGATRYELELDTSLTVARVVRDPSPEVTANIDDCVQRLFLGQHPPGVTHTGTYHFTLSYRYAPPRAPDLAQDLDRLCVIAGRLGPGAPLATLVTEWSVDTRGASILGPEAEAVRAAVEREPRARLYAAIVSEAGSRGHTFACPALERALGRR